MASSPSIAAVRRRSPEMVAPAERTPRELKLLSDIDDQRGNRFHISLLQFYPANPQMSSSDPAAAVRYGLARALVYYYPFAGRLQEAPGDKLAVDCTGEGVLFVEADADAQLEKFGEPPVAPPEWEAELLHVVDGSDRIVGTPPLLIQVTRLSCGGFVVGFRVNHAMCDGSGLAQLFNAIGELARGASSPSIVPVWRRDVLFNRVPPRVTSIHREYDAVPIIDPTCAFPPSDQLRRRYFFFGPSQISALRSRLPPPLRSRCSSFELITACVWRCRNLALSLHPHQQVRTTFTVKVTDLPAGFYGNSFAMPTAVSTAGELCRRPLEYALRLVRAAKASVDSSEYLRSVADLMVLRGRPQHCMVHTYFVSDATRIKFDRVDFGWGPPAYACQVLAKRSSFYVTVVNKINEERGILVNVCLPPEYMERFAEELDKITTITDRIVNDDDDNNNNNDDHFRSSL